jgi:hypothetical protein
VVDLWDGDDSASFAGVPAPVNAGGATRNIPKRGCIPALPIGLRPQAHPLQDSRPRQSVAGGYPPRVPESHQRVKPRREAGRRTGWAWRRG